MAAGYLVPTLVKECTDPNKGQGVFATAPIKQGTLLWQPKHVEAVPADEIISRLDAMPYDHAQVRRDPDQRLLPQRLLPEQTETVCLLADVVASVFRGSLQPASALR